MSISHFPDDELNKLPCGTVAFENHAPWKILYANDLYVSSFSNGSDENLNISDKYNKQLEAAANKAQSGTDGKVSYSAMCMGNNKTIEMTVSTYSDGVLLGILWDATEYSNMAEEAEIEKEKLVESMCDAKNIVFEHNLKTMHHTFYMPNENGERSIKVEKTVGDKPGMPPNAIHPEHRDFFLKNLYNPDEGVLTGQIMLPGHDTYRWYRVSRQFEYDEDGNLTHVYGVMVDIDDEKTKEKERQKGVEIDEDLRIFYRDAAVKRIEDYLKKNPDRRDYALLVMDIDNFKSINDTYGHLYGDTVIEMVAHVLADIRPNFSIAGRYGGDEFFLFMFAADKEEVAETADRILFKLLDFRVADGGSITSSIGISLGEQFDDQPRYKEMFEKADKALYAAKENGKAQWKLYNNSMDESSGRAIDYETDDDAKASMMEQKDLMKVFLEISSSAKTNEDTIYGIIKYVTAKFDFDWMQILQVNSKDDLITVRYEWSRDSDFHNNAGKSGYYVHSDIMKFRKYFEKNSVFTITPENTEGFSKKFQNEFEKRDQYNTIYISDTTTGENFYMFTCIRFDKNREWTAEEMENLNMASKIMTMFISQSGRESQREKELQREVDYDKRTGLYNPDKFYTELGRLRKFAAENDEDIVVFHCEFGNMIQLNLKYGYRVGDDVLADFGRFICSNTESTRAVFGHANGTDSFLCAFRVGKNDYNLIKKYGKEYEMFCRRRNEKYPGVNLVVRTGAYVLPSGEEGGIGFSKAHFAVKRENDRDRCMFEWYEDKTKEHLEN